MVFRPFALILGLAAALSPALALAEDMPSPKAGLWESRMASPNGAMPEMTVKQCMDGKLDFQTVMRSMGGSCDLKWNRVAPDRIETETSCKMGPVAVTGKGVVVGDFNSKLHIETTSTATMEGAAANAAAALGIPTEPQSMIVEASWIGPCEPGQKPGDVILPNGKVIEMPVPEKQQ